MRNIDIIAACSDLGVHINGSNLGPQVLLKNIEQQEINKIKKFSYPLDYKKELQLNNKKKNLREINLFNSKLYNAVKNTLENNCFPITLRWRP